MSLGQTVFLGALLAVLVVILALVVWYDRVGWHTPASDFAACAFAGGVPYDAAGPRPSWTSSTGSVADLRFRGYVFTVADPADPARVYSKDVSAVLNGMAAAYAGSAAAPATLALSRPLNAFSFVIAGVNDPAAVPTPADAARWGNVRTTLVGRWRVA